MARFLVVVGAVLLGVSPASAQWVAPLGVPTPSFGITQTAPARPSPWTSAVAGYYYVEPTHGSATDTANTYGYPDVPRATIPTALAAGAVVELHGTYSAGHGSPNTIVVSGSSGSPVWIRGQDALSRPSILNYWEVRGTYAILEFLDLNDTAALVLLAPGDHLVLRHSDVSGNLDQGGIGLESFASPNTLADVVVYGNYIHDNGDVNAVFDQDVHGIHISARVSSVWIVNNIIARNSGDGIQINATSEVLQSSTHHIYIGNNQVFSNKQAGIWSKQADDVIVSMNYCYDHRPSNSSYGQCMGYQYSTERIWFIANFIEDCEVGIAVSSDNDGHGTESFFVGNIIRNIHPSLAGYDPLDPWDSAGILLVGGLARYVVNNTIYDVHAGVNVPLTGVGALNFTNNIVASVHAGQENHLWAEQDDLPITFSHNVLEGDARIKLGTTQTHYTNAELIPTNSTSNDPLFVNAAAANFALQSGSPARDTGQVNAVYAYFLSLYGQSIAATIDTVSRPQNGTWDMGAYEFVAGDVAPRRLRFRKVGS